MTTPGQRLASTSEPFPDQFEGQLASDIISAARSTSDEEVDALLKAAFLRGKAEVRLALEAISVQTNIQQQRRMETMTRLLLAATVLSAVAATASALAAFAG